MNLHPIQRTVAFLDEVMNARRSESARYNAAYLMGDKALAVPWSEDHTVKASMLDADDLLVITKTDPGTPNIVTAVRARKGRAVVAQTESSSGWMGRSYAEALSAHMSLVAYVIDVLEDEVFEAEEAEDALLDD